jgi:hypothetical protein
MKVAIAILLAAACGKGGDKGGGGGGSATTKPGAPAVTPSKKGLSGEIHLSGAITGTFTWKDDLAMDTCGWVARNKGGGLGATLSDGKDSFISLTATVDIENVRKIVLSGGKLNLPHAGFMSGSSGFEMTGTQNGEDSTVTVIYKKAEVTADGQTVTIDGQLAGTCKYSQ